MASAVLAAFDREIVGVAALHDVNLNDDRRDGGAAAEVERHRTRLEALIDLAVKLGFGAGATVAIMRSAAPLLIELIRFL